MLKVYTVEVRGVEGQCCKIVELLFNWPRRLWDAVVYIH